VEPRIVEKGPIVIAGMDFYGNPFTEKGWSEGTEIGRLWGRFGAFMEANGDRVKNVVDPNVGFEAHCEPAEYGETKNIYVMVGVEVSAIDELPLELCARVFPATTYAVFTFVGNEITSNWPDRIFKEWMPGSGYEEAHKFLLEVYDGDRFKGVDKLAESELDVYVPIRQSR